MYDTPRTIEQILTMLEAAPSRLAGLIGDLPPAQLLVPTEVGEWSARDVLAHLRSCADVWGGYIAVILREERPVIKAVNPTTWIKKTDYCQQDFHPSLQAYTGQRAELLAVLRPLEPDAWSRMALIKGGGKPRERTVYQYALLLAKHENSHIRQMERITNMLRK